MALRYKKLCELLIDRDMARPDLRHMTVVSVAASMIAPICTSLKCDVGDIIARCREWGLPDPQWQVEDGDDFVMVMTRPQSSVRTVDWSVDRSSVRSSVRSEGDESTDGQIITILSTNPRCTLEEIAKVLGFTKRGVEKAVRRLRLAQRLRKVGGKRFGHWEVAE